MTIVNPILADERLIVALDEPDMASARALIDTLGDHVSFYKIGITLMAQGGLKLAHELNERGKFIFQDWKFHDIGAQVQGAVTAASSGPCHMLTVHAEPQVMKAAVAGRQNDKTKIIGVTVMTSLTQTDLEELGYGMDLSDLVKRRALQAKDCGLDGVVASPNEAAMIRALVGPDFLIVTPGVRPMGSSLDDQQRIATPKTALDKGATHLVIGRPITRASDPIAATKAILAEIKG